MSKYSVTGVMMVPFPFEMEVEADDPVAAESVAAREQRSFIKDVHNLITYERPVNVVVQEIEDEEDR